ncbi:MAG: GntR family transcriptional regulator [Pseudomonadota bacterium]|nr:GntR family transcriptional regulator [Pseudomonadota bacterium]
MSETGLIVKVRGMILSGKLPAGRRVTEAGLADELGVSRTPIRSILPALAAEGLLQPVGRRGYAVKAFTERDSTRAIEIRSMIEGLAARVVAREGASDELRALLLDCLAQGDQLFEKRHLVDEDEISYGRMNEKLHSSIVAAAKSSVIDDFYARIKLVPFAAPSTIAFSQHGAAKAYEYLIYAHRQHHAIVAAILSGDSARAEFLFREHAYQPRTSLWPDDVPSPEPPRKRRSKRRA